MAYRIVWAMTGMLVLGFSGACSSTDEAEPTALRPRDFAGEPNLAAPAHGAGRPLVATAPAARDDEDPLAVDPGEVKRVLGDLPAPVITGPGPAAAATQPGGLSGRPLGSHIVDAMVGQVNAQPIYASRVLAPLHEQFLRLGQEKSRSAFAQQAYTEVVRRLNEMVEVAIILSEAERNLTAEDQGRLQHGLNQYRQEMLRRHGGGSEMVADSALRQKTGKSLEQTVADKRQEVLVDLYRNQRIRPRINVSRKDVERYYHRHQDEFNPKPGRTLRLIRVDNAAHADHIDQLLKDGRPFAEVAADRANLNSRETGGLWPDKAVGDKVFGPESLNQAMLALQAGQHSPRIAVGRDFWWIMVESIAGGQARTLDECQQEIRSLLIRARERALWGRYSAELRRQGSYSPMDQMAKAVMDIVLTRYARPD